MNFILEILPKKENGNQFVYVVRAHNGFPHAVCESLVAAMDFIQEKHEQFLAQAKNQS